jgi:putative ABC transport system substrate-binding protein
MARDQRALSRRTFCWRLAGALVAPSIAFAQTSKVRRIGLLWAGTTAENVSRRKALVEALRELGWVEQQTITFDELWADGHYERLPALASELVARKVELMLALNGTPAALAAMNATRQIPIVAPAVGDPVATKLATSLAHPGENVTGSTNLASELYSKRLAFVHEALPGVKHAALLQNNANPYSVQAERISVDAGRSLGIDVETFDVRDTHDFDRVFDEMSRARVEAVLVSADILFQANVEQLGKIALKHGLPLMAGYHAPGVLLAYNVDNVELYRRAASYVDKILKGADAGELPFEQPRHFTLFVDLKTAKALGLTIPQSLLLRADEVIQ